MTSTRREGDAPHDAFLLVSFGGPEAPEDVLPFLRNVTRGRDVPESRLAAVAEHYLHFGGVSPINGQCRALLDALHVEFAAHGTDLPIYWGNRNWHPMLADTLEQMAARRRAPRPGAAHLRLLLLLRLPAVPRGPGRGRAPPSARPPRTSTGSGTTSTTPGSSAPRSAVCWRGSTPCLHSGGRRPN